MYPKYVFLGELWIQSKSRGRNLQTWCDENPSKLKSGLATDVSS